MAENKIEDVTVSKVEDRSAKVAELLRGARGTTSDSKSFRELLGDTFSGTKIVTIKNILTKEFGYVYTDPEDEVVEQPDTATRRVYFGEPKARVLDVGETVTIQGWEAYIALGAMWKEYAISTGSIGTTLSDTNAMREFLSKAYLGIFDPNSVNGSKKVKSTPSVKKAVEKSEDLGFSE